MQHHTSIWKTRLDQMQARRPGTYFNADEVKAAVAQPNAWKTESLMPGDVMEIPLAQQNATCQMVVDSVQVHDDGNVSLVWAFKRLRRARG